MGSLMSPTGCVSVSVVELASEGSAANGETLFTCLIIVFLQELLSKAGLLNYNFDPLNFLYVFQNKQLFVQSW